MKFAQQRRYPARPRDERRAEPGTECAFSLLELLVVIALIVLLLTLYWNPNSGSRERAVRAACQRNLEKLSIGLQIYANDNAGKFPISSNAVRSGEALNLLVPRYSSDPAVFICAGSKDTVPPAGTSLANAKISYAYYMGRGPSNSSDVVLSDAQINTDAKAAGEQVFSTDGKPPGNNHGKSGGNLLFGDGHVQSSSARSAMPLPVRPGERLLNP